MRITPPLLESDLKEKDLSFRRLFERFWKWRYQTRAQNELALLLDLDESDLDCVDGSPVPPPANALHSACEPSALLQWQFESRLSTANHTAKSKRHH